MPPRTPVFLKNSCSCLPEHLFFSKIVVRAPPNVCFPQNRLFVHPRTFVFLKNGCSCTPERLFFSKMVVRAPPNACFSQKRLFRTCRTLVFLKNGCSAPAERLFFSKTVVPHLLNACFPQKWLFQPLGTAVWAALKLKEHVPTGMLSRYLLSKNVCYCLFVNELHPFFYGLHVEGDEAVMALGERLVERFL